MTLRRRIYWKRAAALLAIFGLYFQLLMTALAIPAAFAAMHPGDLPEGYSTIVICTGDGMKQITLDADGTPVGEIDKDLPVTQCAACHIAGGSVFISPAADLLDSGEYPCFRHLPLREQALAEKPAYLIARTRAPPA